MKNQINEIINLGNKMLRKGTWYWGRFIDEENVKDYNRKLVTLKNDSSNLDLENHILSRLNKIKVLDIEELNTIESEQKDNLIERFLFAYWTGDFFLSKQSTIKKYIRNINLTLDILLHEIKKSPL